MPRGCRLHGDQLVLDHHHGHHRHLHLVRSDVKGLIAAVNHRHVAEMRWYSGRDAAVSGRGWCC